MNTPNGRDTILHVAERLIAERGLHGVSAREIVRTAGQRNDSAITYHFGSWNGLLEAVWLAHIGNVNTVRAEMLDAIDADTRTGSPHSSAPTSTPSSPRSRRTSRPTGRGSTSSG
ncbi:helix-turn-helix domain containing protein [Prescottella defluvii]|nr:helix-turn-helix domain containing protein [Prescottella defluvii]